MVRSKWLNNFCPINFFNFTCMRIFEYNVTVHFICYPHYINELKCPALTRKKKYISGFYDFWLTIYLMEQVIEPLYRIQYKTKLKRNLKEFAYVFCLIIFETPGFYGSSSMIVTIWSSSSRRKNTSFNSEVSYAIWCSSLYSNGQKDEILIVCNWDFYNI